MSALFPLSVRFSSSSSPAPQNLASGMGAHSGNHNSQNQSGGGGSSNNNGRDGTVNCGSNGAPAPTEAAGDFNPTAFLWLLSQQQHHQSAAAAAALNLSGRSHSGHAAIGHHPLPNGISSNGASPLGSLAVDKAASNSVNIGSNQTAGQNGGVGNSTGAGQASNKINNRRLRNEDDESTDDEVDDESRSSHSDSQQNPVSSTGFNGECQAANQPATCNRFRPPTGLLRETTAGPSNPHHHQPDSPTHTPVPTPTQPSAGTAAGPQPEQHCLETLLRNIEGLLAIAAHNARQQQSQLHLQKGEHFPDR